MEKRCLLPGTKKEHSKIVAKFVGVRKRNRLLRKIVQDKRARLEREGAVTRRMEKLANTSNIGATGDLVDGASGTG